MAFCLAFLRFEPLGCDSTNNPDHDDTRGSELLLHITALLCLGWSRPRLIVPEPAPLSFNSPLYPVDSLWRRFILLRRSKVPLGAVRRRLAILILYQNRCKHAGNNVSRLRNFPRVTASDLRTPPESSPLFRPRDETPARKLGAVV
jgi:hypothetical protein